MTSIRKTTASQPTPTAKAAPAPAPAAEKKALTFGDSFSRGGPSAAEIKQAKAAIAALATVPGVPLAQSKKAAWLEAAGAKLEAAREARGVLSDAEWAKQLPESEVDAARDTVRAFEDKVRSVEIRAGVRPFPKPLNPFRPVGDVSRSIMNGMGNNVLGAILAPILLPVAIVGDVVDVVTRPIQALVWPVAHAWHGLQWTGRKLGIS